MPNKAKNLSLKDIETLILRQEFLSAGRHLYGILKAIELNRLSLNDEQHNELPSSQPHLPRSQEKILQYFVKVFFAWLNDTSNVITSDLFEAFNNYKRHLHWVFKVTSLENLDFIIQELRNTLGQAKSKKTDKSITYKMLLLMSPSSALLSDKEWEDWVYNLPSHYSIPFWISMLETGAVINPKEAGLKEHYALKFPKMDKQFKITDALAIRASNAWMFVSYLNFREKHQPKKFLNQLMKQWAIEKGVAPPDLRPKKLENIEKPTVLVVNERYTSNHAMYRCYEPSISSLREHFHTIGMATRATCDKESVKTFDEFIYVDSVTDLRKIAGSIIKLKPDIIYYPSLGMEAWTVALAQFRFAPLQIMSLGHPATSMSPEIDYACVRDEADPALFSETLHQLSARSPSFQPYKGKYNFKKIKIDDSVVRIAVNAKHYKINHELVNICKSIEKESESDVEFFFFPNCKDINLAAFKRELNKYIKAQCFPSTNYETYIDRLRACDIVLNPFPFGNTNGIIDCAQIGLPFVCMDGNEVHSKVDLRMSKILGYPKLLRAHSAQEYTNAVLQLISDEGLREEISNHVLQSNGLKTIFKNAPETATFGDDIRELYALVSGQ